MNLSDYSNFSIFDLNDNKLFKINKDFKIEEISNNKKYNLGTVYKDSIFDFSLFKFDFLEHFFSVSTENKIQIFNPYLFSFEDMENMKKIEIEAESYFKDFKKIECFLNQKHSFHSYINILSFSKINLIQYGKKIEFFETTNSFLLSEINQQYILELSKTDPLEKEFI